MKVSSDATWMKAARSGLRKPNAANVTPTPSTAIVPATLKRMMAWVRRAIRIVSTSLDKSLPSRTTSALSRAASVPDPIAMPTLASTSAGASLTPSPTIATECPPVASSRTTSTL
jgi:hypothetical protein